MLAGKKIILAVSGSIAAYKAVYLLRLFKKEGASVRVVTSDHVQSFVGNTSWTALADQPVFNDLWSQGWSEHVHWGNWADLMVVAPATANTLGKMAGGLCDNALMAVFLSANCPVWVAPAMDADMYQHPAVQRNLNILQSDGIKVLPVNEGFLASGLSGPGRMLEPEEILEQVLHFFAHPDFSGKKIMVSAGPTREPIDPVRYLTNHSSGKMGYAIASLAAQWGAEVTLISGPTHLPAPSGLVLQKVETAQEMYKEIMKQSEKQDAIIMAAAVSDYTPAVVATQKLKKQGDDLSIALTRTHDILLALGKRKAEGQKLIGFALETNDELEHAQGKLDKKNLDMIVLNSLRDSGAGFGHDTNKITLIFRGGDQRVFPLKSKSEVAIDILTSLSDMWPRST